jgi:hypothetical protein
MRAKSHLRPTNRLVMSSSPYAATSTVLGTDTMVSTSTLGTVAGEAEGVRLSSTEAEGVRLAVTLPEGVPLSPPLGLGVEDSMLDGETLELCRQGRGVCVCVCVCVKR